MNATLNQKKSLQTVPTTVPRRPQIPLALGPSHQSSWNHCTPSLLPTHPRSNQLKTDHHRAQACPAHCTQTGAPSPSYKAASLLAVISANMLPLRFPPESNIRLRPRHVWAAYAMLQDTCLTGRKPQLTAKRGDHRPVSD
jgi:hypothetical protein